MKKNLISIFFTLICMQVSTSFAMEHVTHFMQETSKQFEGYSWWIKAPVLVVGTYAFTRCCNSFYSRMFGKKMATQQEVQLLSQQLTNISQEVVKIGGEILNLKSDVLELNDFASQSRYVLLGKIRKKKKLKKSIKGFNHKLDLLLSNVDLSPRKKRYSCGEISPRTFDFNTFNNGKRIKRKKRNKGKEKLSTTKRSQDTSLSKIDIIYREQGVGTQRDPFTSDTDSINEGEKFP